MDNERSFVSPIVQQYIKSLGVQVYQTPPQKSEVNGTIERVHSTIVEIVRCLQMEYKELTLKEVVNIAVDRYNNSFHSVTNMKPNEIFFGRIQRISFEDLTNARNKVNQDLTERISKNQKVKLDRENLKRHKPKTYEPGQTIYVAIKQIQGKTKPIYKKEIVEKDNVVTVTTTSGKRVHKSLIKNND